MLVSEICLSFNTILIAEACVLYHESIIGGAGPQIYTKSGYEQQRLSRYELAMN